MSYEKILLLGSAPYVEDWWADKGRAFREAGYSVATLNNALAVPPSPDLVFVSSDYRPQGERAREAFVSEAIKAGIHHVKKLPGGRTPLWYFTKHGNLGVGPAGTVFLTAAYVFINFWLTERIRNGVLAIAGCDMQYDTARTAFYGNARPDPLRLGEDWLGRDLRILKHVYEGNGFSILNAGGQDATRLPFARLEEPF